jgi:hypothetical protein
MMSMLSMSFDFLISFISGMGPPSLLFRFLTEVKMIWDSSMDSLSS